MKVAKVIQEYVNAGLITAREHRGLTIYNYTDKVQRERLWNEVTRTCRGLIVDSEGRVVASPWPKFFNHDEGQSPIPPGPPDEVTVKMDGSLGILYVHPDDGRSYWATRGSMTSEQAEAANSMWDSSITPPEGWTVMAEIIHPSSTIVVQYDFSALVVLGARRGVSSPLSGAGMMIEVPYEEVAAWADSVGLPMVERVSGDLSELVKRAATLDAQHEGFVARWGGVRLKVKGAEYRRVHRMLQRFNHRRVGDAWYADNTDWFAELPVTHRAMALDWAEELDKWTEYTREFVARTAELAQQHTDNRAACARWVQASNPDHFKLVMQVLYGKGEPDYRAQAYRRRFGGRPRPVEVTP